MWSTHLTIPNNMINIKENFKTIVKAIWDGGFFNHPEDQKDGYKSLLVALHNNYKYKLSELKKCSEKGEHKWETHSTDSGTETFCSKCFVFKPYFDGQRDILERLLIEVL